MRIGHSWWKLVLLACMTAACTSPAHDGPPREVPTDSGVDPSLERSLSIYANVIRQLVTDASVQGAPGYAAIYVVDGPVAHASDPMRQVDRAPTEAFDAALLNRLDQELSDLPHLEFVHERDAVVTGTPPGHVIHHGALVTLGDLDDDASRVEVEANIWVNGLNGRWLTYVVERQDGSWIVTGTTGPMAIS